MEVDEELEAGLLRQFNCLNTSDKDVLIKELQGVLGRNSNISEQSARFYLDMADWNLQAAICAYFDLETSPRLPQMTFVQDITIGEGESVPPNTSFIKTWRVENSGVDVWPEGCRLQHTGGVRLGAAETSEPLLCVPPSTALDISMQMVAPQEKGLYSSKWRMATQQGHFFGDTIWVIIHVDDGGTLALMQQMVNLKELGTSPPNAPPPSPAHGLTPTGQQAAVANPFCPTTQRTAHGGAIQNLSLSDNSQRSPLFSPQIMHPPGDSSRPLHQLVSSIDSKAQRDISASLSQTQRVENSFPFVSSGVSSHMNSQQMHTFRAPNNMTLINSECSNTTDTLRSIYDTTTQSSLTNDHNPSAHHQCSTSAPSTFYPPISATSPPSFNSTDFQTSSFPCGETLPSSSPNDTDVHMS